MILSVVNDLENSFALAPIVLRSEVSAIKRQSASANALYHLAQPKIRFHRQ